jgi:quercetin dioxygenase-like cupin family protein
VHAALLFGVVALGCSARHQAPVGAATELLGTWRLVEFWDRDSAKAPKYYRYGEQPTGYFVYDPSGHVSIQIQKGPMPVIVRPERGENWFQSASLEELRMTMESFRAYFGTYSVDLQNAVVIHQVEGDSRALYTGTPQRRRFRLVGDSLIIGNDTTARRVLLRVRSPAIEQEKSVPVEKEPYHKMVFNNRYVQVFRVQLDPGKTGLMHTHFHDDASVRLSTATVAADSPGEPIGAPEPVYPGLLSARDNEAKPHTHRVHNIGTTLFDVILVQALERPAGPSSPAVSLPGVENSRMRVYRYDIGPGITTPQHVHARPFVFAAVTDVDLETISSNGSISRRLVKAGDIQWIDARVTHSFANRGTAKAILVEFELK